jgi:hypothetical protein
MKNACCHDDKMEAYCKAVRALEDKFYGIELNHVPRRYNEEADELAKIASGRITIPRTSSLGTSLNRPSPSSRTPRAARNPRGLHRIEQGQSPWTRTPRTRHTCSPSSRGTALARPKSWMSSRPPAGRTGATNTSPGWTEGNSPRTGPRPGASPGWPNPSPSSTASCTSAPPPASCSDACPSPRGVSSSGIYTRVSAATMPRPTPS